MKAKQVTTKIAELGDSLRKSIESANQALQVSIDNAESIGMLLAIIPQQKGNERDVRISSYKNSIDIVAYLNVKSFNRGLVPKVLSEALAIEFDGLSQSVNSTDSADYGYREYTITWKRGNWYDDDKLTISLRIVANLIEGGSNTCKRIVVGEETVTEKRLKYSFQCK